MALRLELDATGVRAFCTRWNVAELAVFGSVTRDDFRPDSDLDVLVSPEPGATWSRAGERQRGAQRRVKRVRCNAR
jgi:hypothetical protein